MNFADRIKKVLEEKEDILEGSANTKRKQVILLDDLANGLGAALDLLPKKAKLGTELAFNMLDTKKNDVVKELEKNTVELTVLTARTTVEDIIKMVSTLQVREVELEEEDEES